MKKIINKAIIFVFSLLSIASYSQEIKFGVKGSIHRSNISEIHQSSKGRMAGSIGGLVQFPLGYDNMFFIQPEVVYSMQGEKDGNYKMNQDYINIPIWFRAYFSEGDSEFFGELGPQIGFLISEKNKDRDIQKYNDSPKSMDLSIGLGVGYSILRKYEIGIRYNYGFTDIYEDYPNQERSSVLGIHFSYIFN